MSRRVYLHIGAPKTGTTYVQDRLALNARSLADHGVHVPGRSAVSATSLGQFRAALDLLDQDWGGPAGHARGSWEALVRRIRRLDGTVVVSHEILAPAEPHQVRRALDDLAGSEIHVVYSARDLARQVPAAWQESIKQGRAWSYRRYGKRLVAKPTRFLRSFDLPGVLETWGADLPPEQVHVVTVPQVRGDGLWLRFCEVVGIDPAWAPRDSEQRNRSLGAAETQLLRRLNRSLDTTVRRDPTYDALVRFRLAEGVLAQRRGKPLQLPPRLHPWATAEAERWIAWIQEHGVDVAGDLDDLLPGPPVAKVDYVNPDRVTSKAQLRVALDALAAMTHEAARRPDPDLKVTARVRGRIRGLRDVR